jgi:hypothetical protein
MTWDEEARDPRGQSMRYTKVRQGTIIIIDWSCPAAGAGVDHF